MPIMYRHILAELAKVFFMALAGLTMMMLVVGIVREAQMQNIPINQVMKLIPYILPDALRFAVPVTLLLAVSFVYGRMSGANEILAVKALGISPLVLLWPTLIAAFLLSLVSVWLNDVAVSWGRSGVRRVVIESIEEIAYSMLRAQRSYGARSFSINVLAVEGRRLIEPSITFQAGRDSPLVVIRAEEAELRADHQQRVLRITLRNGSLHVGGKLCYQFPNVEQREIPIGDDEGWSPTPSTTPLWQIPQQLEGQRQAVDALEHDLAVRATYHLLCGEFQELASSRWTEQLTTLHLQRETIHRLLTEPHRRWAGGFSCLVFAMVGAPLAMRLRHREYLTIFFLCFAPILVIYYPVLILSIGGAKSGALPPWAVWSGNLLLASAGLLLLRKVLRY